MLGRLEVMCLWLVFIGAAVVVRVKTHGTTSVGADGTHTPFAWRAIWGSADDRLTRAQLVAIAFLVLATLTLALIAAPSTADSMTYHLPRIEHWIQNHGVAPYPTNIQRQLWPGPGAEYIMLHAELLSGSDRGVTLVQWAAYAGDIILVSLIARQLGGTARQQWLAAFLAASLPGAAAQASGSQVELVFAFWLLCSVSIGLSIRKLKRAERWLGVSLLFGAAIGLAIFTKATMYIYFAPFAIWFIVASLASGGFRNARIWMVAAVVALAINGPHYYGNVLVYGKPLSEPGANGVVNSSFFAAGTLSNVVRNLSLHFGTPFDRVNSAAESAVVSFDRSLGIAPDDKRTTFPGARYHFAETQSLEQTAGSPIHVTIAIVALLLIFASKKRSAPQLAYMTCAASAFLLFCFYLRWQPWHARLHVPLLLIAASASALIISRLRSPILLWGISALAFASALPALLHNPARQLIGNHPVYTIARQRQYFADNAALYEPYLAAVNRLKQIGCHDLGLWVPGDAAEYPLWALLRAGGLDDIRIRHVSVDNPSAQLARIPRGDSFTPCALVFIDSEGRYKRVAVPNGYHLTWEHEMIRIYTPTAPQNQVSTTASSPASRSLSATSIASSAEIPMRVAMPIRSSVPSA